MENREYIAGARGFIDSGSDSDRDFWLEELRIVTTEDRSENNYGN